MAHLSLLFLFMGTIIFVNCKSKNKKCVDQFAECRDHTDDCVAHPGFMVINCPKTCNTCHLQDPKVRCSPDFLNISTTPILQTDDMNRMFNRIQQNEESVNVLSGVPWALEFNDFLSGELIDELLSQVTEWERSYESGEIGINGAGSNIATQTRTSSTFWCNNDCQTTSVSQHITDKMESLLQIPKIHYEPIQLLKYNVNESYVTHHDFSYEELALPCGPRILTFFLYLSDVEEGGATHFPDLNLTITPKKGKAVLWPNTLSIDPRAKDTRMSHEAQRVMRGVKYAANVWIHLLEWDRPSLWSCTGS